MTKPILIAILLFGCKCGGMPPDPAPDPDAAFEYSHTVAGIDTPECLDLQSTCPDVKLLCAGATELAPACHDVAGQSTDAYALPDAASAPNRPFGVASCIELVACL